MSISSSTPHHHHHHHHNSRTTSEHGSRTSNRGNPTPETIQHRVMKSVSDYNRQLNQERKDDRQVCMDLQTYTVQYPVGLGRENRGLRRWSRKRRRISPTWRNGRRYPIALLPNQYQDWFLRYTPQELNYLPLNTVLHGPVAPDFDKLSPSLIQMTKNQQNENDTDSEMDGSDVLSDFDDDSTCSCGEVHCASSPPMKSLEESMDNSQSSTNNKGPSIESFGDGNFSQPSLANLQFQNGHNDHSSEVSSSLKICKICKQDTQGSNIEPLCCADCGVICHPVCLDINDELLQAIRLYRWQCQDCKSCQKCGQPHDEEKMMFCDKCDRGYHTYCIGLVDIPQGHWVCSLCAICANCGTKNPGETNNTQTLMEPLTISTANNNQHNNNAQWQPELIKIHSPDGQTMVRHSVFCETCYQLRKF